jgi:hypothetical protein
MMPWLETYQPEAHGMTSHTRLHRAALDPPEQRHGDLASTPVRATLTAFPRRRAAARPRASAQDQSVGVGMLSSRCGVTIDDMTDEFLRRRSMLIARFVPDRNDAAGIERDARATTQSVGATAAMLAR